MQQEQQFIHHHQHDESHLHRRASSAASADDDDVAPFEDLDAMVGVVEDGLDVGEPKLQQLLSSIRVATAPYSGRPSITAQNITHNAGPGDSPLPVTPPRHAGGVVRSRRASTESGSHHHVSFVPPGEDEATASPDFAGGDWDVVPFDIDAVAATANQDDEDADDDEADLDGISVAAARAPFDDGGAGEPRLERPPTAAGKGKGMLAGLFAKRASAVAMAIRATSVGPASRKQSTMDGAPLDRVPSMFGQPAPPPLAGANSFAKFIHRFSTAGMAGGMPPLARGSSFGSRRSSGASQRSRSNSINSTTDEPPSEIGASPQGVVEEDSNDLLFLARLGGVRLAEARSRGLIDVAEQASWDAFVLHRGRLEASEVSERHAIAGSSAGVAIAALQTVHHKASSKRSGVMADELQERRALVLLYDRAILSDVLEPWRRAVWIGAAVRGAVVLQSMAIQDREGLQRAAVIRREAARRLDLSSAAAYVSRVTAPAKALLLQHLTHVEEVVRSEMVTCAAIFFNATASTSAVLVAELKGRPGIAVEAQQERCRLLVEAARATEAQWRSAIKRVRALELTEIAEQQHQEWRAVVALMGPRILARAIANLCDELEPAGRREVSDAQQAARVKLLKSHKSRRPKPVRPEMLLDKAEAEARQSLISDEADVRAREVQNPFEARRNVLRRVDSLRSHLRDVDEVAARNEVMAQQHHAWRFLFTLELLHRREQELRERLRTAHQRRFDYVIQWCADSLAFERLPPEAKRLLRTAVLNFEKSEQTRRRYLHNEEAAARDALTLPFGLVAGRNNTTNGPSQQQQPGKKNRALLKATHKKTETSSSPQSTAPRQTAARSASTGGRSPSPVGESSPGLPPQSPAPPQTAPPGTPSRPSLLETRPGTSPAFVQPASPPTTSVLRSRYAALHQQAVASSSSPRGSQSMEAPALASLLSTRGDTAERRQSRDNRRLSQTARDSVSSSNSSSRRRSSGAPLAQASSFRRASGASQPLASTRSKVELPRRDDGDAQSSSGDDVDVVIVPAHSPKPPSGNPVDYISPRNQLTVAVAPSTAPRLPPRSPKVLQATAAGEASSVTPRAPRRR